MPISDEQLDKEIQRWKAYAELRPQSIKVRDLLKQRNLSMYRAQGITDPLELGRAMVADRSSATLEMTFGYLFERIFEALGLRKISRDQKQLPGFKGLDFVRETPAETEVINLKSGLSTSNGDISMATSQHLKTAKEHRDNLSEDDDNPLQRPERKKVVMVRAIARGSARKVHTPDGILYLVGDAMWEHFGAGKQFLARLSEALGRNPINRNRYEKEKEKAAHRVATYLRNQGLVKADVTLDWASIVANYP